MTEKEKWVRHFHDKLMHHSMISLCSDRNPVGKVTRFLYRVESQARGTLHIHSLIWAEYLPDYR